MRHQSLDEIARHEESNPKHGYSIVNNTNPERIVIHCLCGAWWTINKQEFESGDDKMKEHMNYGQKLKSTTL